MPSNGPVSHYDYEIQAWIDTAGHVLPCGHGHDHQLQNIEAGTCTACRFAGIKATDVQKILEARRNERRAP